MIAISPIPIPLSYSNLRSAFISQVEGTRAKPYLDSEGFASIGIGFNLHHAAVRAAVYDRIIEDFPDNQAQADYLAHLTPVFSTVHSSPTAFKNAFDAVPVPAGAVSFQMSSVQIIDVFDSIVPSYELILSNKVKIGESYERLALVSLTYNNPSLVGPGLLSAMKDDNRAEAWYEIRYGSNANQSAGLEARRYYESDVFGVFRSHAPLDSTTYTNADALELLTTRSRHIDPINNFLDEFGEPINHYLNPIVPINSSNSIFNVAIEKVCKKYKVDYSEVICDYRRITAGVVAADEVNKLTCNKYNITDGALMLAGDGNNRVLGSEFGDTIYTGVGNDTVFGGEGDDTIFDLGGINRLAGGRDDDTYVITFVDPDQLPVIVESFDQFSSWDTIIFKTNPTDAISLAKYQNVEAIKYTGKAPADLTIVNGSMNQAGFWDFTTDCHFSFGSSGGVVHLSGVYTGNPIQINGTVTCGKGNDTIAVDPSFSGPIDEFGSRHGILDIDLFSSGRDKIDLSDFGASAIILSGSTPSNPGKYAVYSPGGAVEIVEYDRFTLGGPVFAVASEIFITLRSGFLSAGDILI